MARYPTENPLAPQSVSPEGEHDFDVHEDDDDEDDEPDESDGRVKRKASLRDRLREIE